jgi:hypothetical protein
MSKAQHWIPKPGGDVCALWLPANLVFNRLNEASGPARTAPNAAAK